MSSQTHSFVTVMRISLFDKIRVNFFSPLFFFGKVSRPWIKHCNQNVNIINQCKFGHSFLLLQI